MVNALPPWYVWFDGLAGAVIIAIGGFVAKRFLFKPEKIVEAKNAIVSGSITGSQVAAGSNITQTSVVHHHHIADEPATELVATQPDPIRILGSLANLPPYDLNHACKKFVGLRVLWRITFDGVSETSGNAWNVGGSFQIPSLGGKAFVSFDISSIPPELKIIYRDTPIWVRGIVRRVCYPSVIYLESDPELLKIEHS